MRRLRGWALSLGCMLVAGCAPSPGASGGPERGAPRPVEVAPRSLSELSHSVFFDTSSVARRLQDRALATRVLLALSDVPALQAHLPRVNVRAGRVTLRGVVPSEALRQRAVQVAARLPGVVQVLDALEIEAADTSAASVRYHTVRPGETLWDIAQRYGLSVLEIRRLNSLRGSTIRPGQRLRVR